MMRRPGELLLQPDALVLHEIEELVVRAQRRALVLEGLEQDLPDPVLVRFDQLADLEGRVTAERRNVLAGDRGWFMPSIAWLRIQPMIGMRARPNTISE
jgi:hypothetical protein